MRLLCKLGLHNWQWFNSFASWNPDLTHVRLCRRCDVMQFIKATPGAYRVQVLDAA